MKNIIPLILACFVAVQVHGAIRTVKFIDVNGKEPQEKNYDQYCQLIDCADNTEILNNNVKLAIGDELIIQTPQSHNFFFPYNYAIENGTPAGICNLKAARVENDNSLDNRFRRITLLAVAPGVEGLDIHFSGNVNYFNAGYDPVRKLLGHITITVTE